MSLFIHLAFALKSAIKTFISSDLDVMSDEVKQILSNPNDAKKYKDAIMEIKEGKEEVTITLDNNSTLTLVQ